MSSSASEGLLSTPRSVDVYKRQGLIENMSYAVCPQCGETLYLFGPSRGEELAESSGIPYLGALPLDPELARFCDLGRVEEYDSEAMRSGIRWTEIVNKEVPE